MNLKQSTDEIMALADDYCNAAELARPSIAMACRDKLRAAIGTLQADAARYQWLRDAHPTDGTVWVAKGTPKKYSGISCWRHEELDSEIDAAMARRV